MWWHHRSVTIVTMELQTYVLSTLADCYSVTSHQYDVIVITITYILRHWYWSMTDSVCHALPNFQGHYKLKFFHQEASDFLKHFFLKSFDSVFKEQNRIMKWMFHHVFRQIYKKKAYQWLPVWFSWQNGPSDIKSSLKGETWSLLTNL